MSYKKPLLIIEEDIRPGLLNNLKDKYTDLIIKEDKLPLSSMESVAIDLLQCNLYSAGYDPIILVFKDGRIRERYYAKLVDKVTKWAQEIDFNQMRFK